MKESSCIAFKWETIVGACVRLIFYERGVGILEFRARKLTMYISLLANTRYLNKRCTQSLSFLVIS